MSNLGRATEALLTTQRFGRPLIHVVCTGSTMDDARALALKGAAPGAAIVADEQSSGRGRFDRTFVSPPGGLYLTLILTPPGDPTLAWRLGFAAAWAAREAVRAAGGPELTFDWPNDLILGQRKVGGVLLELLTPPAVAAPLLLMGVGLNLGPDPRAIDAERSGPAGPVVGLPAADPRPQVAATLLAVLEDLVPHCATAPGWRFVLDLVRGSSQAAMGRPVAVRDAAGVLVEGLGVGLRADGALLVEGRDGRVTAVRYGERLYDRAAAD